MCGRGFGIGLLLGQAKGDDVWCRFCGKQDGDGHLLWDLSFLHIIHVRELPESLPFIARDRSKWPRCLLWYGWLPGLRVDGERAPRADSQGQLAVKLARVGLV